MRAATASRFVFVGSAIGGGLGMFGGQPGRSSIREPEYVPNVIAPNLEIRQARQDVQATFREKQAFWQEELEQWGMGEISASLVEMLRRMELGFEQG